MRLIDADKVRSLFDPNTFPGEMMIAITDGMPTVYDVDAVCSFKGDDSKT